jgi:fumarate hydratase subunit beta
MKKSIITPLTEKNVKELNAGDEVLISGIIFTARDAAHKRLTALIDSNQKLPVDLKDQVLYYTGPTPAQPGKVIGSAGPTTSSRMDRYTPKLIQTTRLRGIIGKGNRSPDVIKSFIDYGCIYFAAIGGAGALLSKCITASEIVCYEDLGAEAIYKLTVKNFPAIVAIDSMGNNLYMRDKCRRV